MKDTFGREINYLRISVTDKCNLRCRYCMPEEGVADLGHENILTFEEIHRVVVAAAKLGITKYRLTGGEPLVRRGIVGLVEQMKQIPGVEKITMTTNGILLPQMAEKLKEAGLDRVNISLDSLRHDRYREITRGGDLNQAIAGINAASKAGLVPIKLNVVMMKGFNDDEILDFVQLTLQHDYEVRFIELMPVGRAENDFTNGYMSSEEIKARLPQLIPVEKQEGVAEIYRYRGALGRIGFITPISCNFCSQCNKLRLTADGKLKTCLHSEKEIDLKKALREGQPGDLEKVLTEAIKGKEEKHHLGSGQAPISRDMNKIGG